MGTLAGPSETLLADQDVGVLSQMCRLLVKVGCCVNAESWERMCVSAGTLHTLEQKVMMACVFIPLCLIILHMWKCVCVCVLEHSLRTSPVFVAQCGCEVCVGACGAAMESHSSHLECKHLFLNSRSFSVSLTHTHTHTHLL